MFKALFLMFRLEFLRVQYWAIDFSIFTFDMSFYTDECDITSYVHDNTLYTSSFSLDGVIDNLGLSSSLERTI